MKKTITQLITLPANLEEFEIALRETTTPEGTSYTRAIIWANKEECDDFLPFICTKGHAYYHIALAYTSGMLDSYMVHEPNVTPTPSCVFIHIPSAIPIAADVYEYCKYLGMDGPITFINFNEEVDNT